MLTWAFALGNAPMDWRAEPRGSSHSMLSLPGRSHCRRFHKSTHSRNQTATRQRARNGPKYSLAGVHMGDPVESDNCPHRLIAFEMWQPKEGEMPIRVFGRVRPRP